MPTWFICPLDTQPGRAHHFLEMVEVLKIIVCIAAAFGLQAGVGYALTRR